MFGFLEGIHIYFNDSRGIEHNFLNTIVFLHFVHLKCQDLHQASFMERMGWLCAALLQATPL